MVSAALTLVLDDPYSTLGVRRDASAKDLKRAYRRAAASSHPDKRHGAADADATFRRVVEAYDLLSDAEKRAEYDKSPVWTRLVLPLTAPSTTTLEPGILKGDTRMSRCLRDSRSKDESSSGHADSPSSSSSGGGGGQPWDVVTTTWRCLRTREVMAGATTSSAGDLGWWRTSIASSFLHFNAVHLLFNVWRLIRFGDVVEQRLGQRAFVATFVLGGVAGNALFAWVDGRAHVGATASVFALQGAAFTERRQTEGAYLNWHNSKMLLSFLLEVLLTSLAEVYLAEVMDGAEINYWAHLGGFVGGLLVMELMLQMQKRTQSERSTYGVAAVCLVALAAATFELWRGLIDSGPWALLAGMVRSGF